MLTVVSKGHTLIYFSSSSKANKVFKLDLIREGKLFFWVRIQPFCLEVTPVECCSNGESRIKSHCFSDVEANKYPK